MDKHKEMDEGASEEDTENREELPPRALTDLHPNLDDFEREAVTQIIGDITGKARLNYSEFFSSSAKVLRLTGDQCAADAVEFLACVMQPMLKASDTTRPFQPMFEMGGKRGLIPDDFDDQQIDIIGELAMSTADPMIQARLSDVAWLRKRLPVHAKTAISAYLLTAERFMDARTENDRNLAVPALDFIERAVRLSLYAFKEPDRPSEPKDALLAFAPSLFSEGEFGLVLTAEELVYSLRLADIGERVDFIEEVATSAEKSANPHLARDFWLLVAKLQKQLANSETEKAARIKAAEIMVALAEHTASSEAPSYMAASAHLSDALKIYRQVSGEAERKEVLRSTLSLYQPKILDEMTGHSTEIDLSEPAEKARQRVSGKTLPNALSFLAFIATPSELSELEKQVYKQAEKFPMQYLMNISVSDRDGRTVDVIPSLIASENEAEKKKALRYHMMRQADFGYAVVSGGMIEPARAQIWEEHYISPEILWPLVEQSLFVPDGHEGLFAKGLAAGLEGDYATALHILVPQFENALRELLKRQGHVVNTKEKNDQITQEAVTLGAILSYEAITEELGEGLVFDLESLLSDKLGVTLRHDIAHGLSGDALFHKGGNSAYVFCLILRLVILPLIPADREAPD